MNYQQLITDIRNFCIENASEEGVVKYSRYFKDARYNAYGLTATQMRLKAREMLKTPGLTLSAVLDAMPGLIQSGKHEEVQLAMLLISGLHKQFTRDTFDRIETWFSTGIDNWAQADNLALSIISLFLSKKIISLEDLTSWLSARNKFQRRCVPVALIKSLKTQGNYAELFTFIGCLMTDPEREVHQGTGWFLREAWKRKPGETEAFLLIWKNISPRLIFQYATEKMTPEHKQKFRKEAHV